MYFKTRVLIAAALLSIALSACGGDETVAQPAATVTVTAEPSDDSWFDDEAQDAGEAAETEPATAPNLRPKDFEIKLRIKEQECFGSAGCLITYQIDPSYKGSANLEGFKWEVTYEVQGGDSGPVVNTFVIKNGGASYDREENISTPPDPELTAKVTAIYEW